MSLHNSPPHSMLFSLFSLFFTHLCHKVSDCDLAPNYQPEEILCTLDLTLLEMSRCLIKSIHSAESPVFESFRLKLQQ